MGVELIYYNALMLFLRSIRFVVQQLMLVQRLPFLVFGALFIVFGRLSYALFGKHRFFLLCLKWLFRVSFWFRGIRLVVEAPNDKSLKECFGIHMCNNFHLAYWVLFAYLPYDHLIISNDVFFSNEMFRSMLFLFGFYPQEYGLTPDNFKSFESRLDVYLDQKFSLWQPIFFEYRDSESLPYGIVMALKHDLPINVWKFHFCESLDRVHWLNRRKIILQLVNQVAISRRYPLTISAFYQTVEQHFGRPLTDDKLARQSVPGMPPSSTDLAKEKIAAAKKLADKLESEGPFQ